MKERLTEAELRERYRARQASKQKTLQELAAIERSKATPAQVYEEVIQLRGDVDVLLEGIHRRDLELAHMEEKLARKPLAPKWSPK